MAISRSPLSALRAADFREVQAGRPILDLAPAPGGLLICRVNGEWLARESWGSATRSGDVIEWYDLPQDKDTLRGVLLIASIFIPQFFALQGLWAAVAVTAAQLAINLLLPPTGSQQRRPEETAPSFSSTLSGNQARLDQPIWKTCGRREITPPFAGQLYLEYLPRAGAEDPQLDREQYLYAIYAVGVGDYEVTAKIANTPLSRFADVVVAQYLAPGEQPSVVRANVTSAAEVSSQVLDTGIYVGGFAACAARRTAESIGIDVVATRGLGKSGALTVSWRVEYREINDFGQALGSWETLGSESRTAFTATPQRWSSTYTLPTPARVEVRLVRTDVQDTDPSALHEIAWTGLRAYLAEPAPLNPYTAHFELVMRASSQLSNAASREVRLITKGFVRSLDEDLLWVAATHSRNPAWWLLDLATSPTWGVNKPEDRVDLQSFYDLAQICEARQDRFDWTFDSTLNAWDAMQLIARSCRSRVFRRNGVISVARDELADTPVTAFTPRNCLPGMRISETLRTRKSPDGVILEYQDHRTWEWTEISCPCPGVGGSPGMTNPVRKRLEGVTGATHAEREGIYEAYNLLYRTRRVQFTTEMQGMLPTYLSPVDFLADLKGYGKSGDVVSWDDDALVMTLTEPPNWEVAPLFLTLVRHDGTLTDPVEVSPGPTVNDVVLPAEPDFNMILDGANLERPKYLLGAKDMVKVAAIEDGGKTQDGAQLFRISGLIDDDRVHQADVHLLPGPGDIQDPVGEPNDDEGGGTALVVRLRNTTYDLVSTNADASVSLLFKNNGTTLSTASANTFATTTPPVLSWLLNTPVETSVAGTFEIRATLLSGATPDSGVLDTWTPLDADFGILYSRSPEGSATATLKIEIRDADGIVQGSANFIFFISAIVGGGA